MTILRNPTGSLTLKLGCVAFSVLALVACGGGGSSTPATATTGTTTAGTPKGNTTTGTLNPVMAKTYNLKFFKGSGSGCGTVCAYTEGQSITVVAGTDGSLTVGTLVLTSPFYRKFGTTTNSAEIIWLDGAANIEYALSNNTSGTFNEINVGDASKSDAVGIPGFIGQIR